MKILLGILWFVVIIWNGLAIAKRQRQSGRVTDYGHPKEDKFLLLGSAIALIATTLTLLWWMGSKLPETGSGTWYLFASCFVAFSYGITLVANRILRLSRRKRR
jgi:hypothetical protein